MNAIGTVVFGNGEPLSKIERVVEHMQSLAALDRPRVVAFDQHAGMSYAPVQHCLRPFAIDPADIPTDSWIADAFISFVRTEFAMRNESSIPTSWPPVILKQRVVDFDAILQLLDHGQQRISRNRLSIDHGGNTPDEVARSIYEFLCSRDYGSRRNRSLNPADGFVRRLTAHISGRERLLFVLPGFPFKDQNRFRVPFDAEFPDLADIALMMRLHLLTQAIYQVHPYGADVVVLSDGQLYADLFGVAPARAARYLERLRGIRNSLNLQGTVSIVDLKSLLDLSSGSESRGGVWSIVDHVANRLSVLVDSDPQCADAYATLVQGMKRNMNTRDGARDLSDADLWSILRASSSADSPAAFRFERQARDAAVRYSSMNLAIRWTEFTDRVFPGSIRATMHPKPGQFCLAGTGGAYAWNAVAWCEQMPRSIDDVQARPFSALCDYVPGVVEVVVGPDRLPLFYTRADDD